MHAFLETSLFHALTVICEGVLRALADGSPCSAEKQNAHGQVQDQMSHSPAEVCQFLLL